MLADDDQDGLHEELTNERCAEKSLHDDLEVRRSALDSLLLLSQNAATREYLRGHRVVSLSSLRPAFTSSFFPSLIQYEKYPVLREYHKLETDSELADLCYNVVGMPFVCGRVFLVVFSFRVRRGPANLFFLRHTIA